LLRYTRTEPVVIALTNAEEVADAIRKDGVPVHSLGMHNNRDFSAVCQLAELIARERPDVVHVHLYRATLYGRVAARLAGVPVVVTTEHSLLDGVIEGRPVTSAVRGLYRATEPLNTATVAVSQAVADRLVRWGVPDRKIHIVPNGLDLAELAEVGRHRERIRRELLLTDDTQVIGGIGRLTPTKRWDLLLRAVAPTLGPKRQLLLLGAGEDEGRLRDMAAVLHVGAWVRFLGAHINFHPMLSAFDLVASPSPQETFGLALLEAVAARIRVVYVASPALDAIGPMEGVVRVPEEEAALREAILGILREPPEVPPSPALQQFDVRLVAARIDALYQDCLSNKGKARPPKDGFSNSAQGGLL